MNCVNCGRPIQPGTTRCSCGQYIDLSPAELYSQIEKQVQTTSKSNFRKGFLTGLAFLLAFLILETVIEKYEAPFLVLLTAAGIAALASLIYLIWEIYQHFTSDPDRANQTYEASAHAPTAQAPARQPPSPQTNTTIHPPEQYGIYIEGCSCKNCAAA